LIGRLALHGPLHRRNTDVHARVAAGRTGDARVDDVVALAVAKQEASAPTVEVRGDIST
jgi:hypothetical protein